MRRRTQLAGPGLLCLLPLLLASCQRPLPKLEIPPAYTGPLAYAGLDPSTNLHITGVAQDLDVTTWRLKVGGLTKRSLELDYDSLRRLPRRETKDPIICTGQFEDYAHWAGASLPALLDRAGVLPTAKVLTLVGADGYEATVSLAEARSKWALLAYEWEGRALPKLHGYPVRAAFPGLPGNRWVKWLVEIRVE